MSKTEWTIETARWRQTSHVVPTSEWAAYRTLLVEERDAGRVFGWTAIPHRDGVQVICTHQAEQLQAS